MPLYHVIFDFFPILGYLVQMLVQTCVLSTTKDLQKPLNRCQGAIFVKFSETVTVVSAAPRSAEWIKMEKKKKKKLDGPSCEKPK